jgi:hypothetical protein
VIKDAREIPIDRRIEVASFSLAFPRRAQTDAATPSHWYWLGEEVQIAVSPVVPVELGVVR